MTNPIYVAIDTVEMGKAVALARTVSPNVGGLKLGLEFFLTHGHEGYRNLAKFGLPIFLDLKLHDIPNTVKGALRAILPLGPSLLTIHASGGPAMIEAARTMAEEMSDGEKRTKIIAVSVLTSLDDQDLAAIGMPHNAADQVATLAKLAHNSGADGLVCSPFEIATARKAMGEDATLVVPGIRPNDSQMGDQKRVMTPKQARGAGADILVIGRPITQALDPAEAAWAISIDL